jgi:hypothetical protein
MVPGKVGSGGADDALLLPEADGVFGGIGVLAGFDFDENERVAVPGDDVDFAGFGAVAGGNDAVAKSAEVVDAEDFGSAAEGEETMEKEGKRHIQNLGVSGPLPPSASVPIGERDNKITLPLLLRPSVQKSQ